MAMSQERADCIQEAAETQMAIERVKAEHAAHQAEARARYDAEGIGCVETLALVILAIAGAVCLIV